MKTRTSIAASALILSGLILHAAGSREPVRGQSGSAGSPLATGGGFGDTGFSRGLASGMMGSSSSDTSRNKIRQAVDMLRRAKDAAQKDKAQKNLATVLQEQFDVDLKRRETEIANIEARVKQLQSILEKRRTARDEIVKLQIQVLVNEAAGLGFPTDARIGRRGVSAFSVGGRAPSSPIGMPGPARIR